MAKSVNVFLRMDHTDVICQKSCTHRRFPCTKEKCICREYAPSQYISGRNIASRLEKDRNAVSRDTVPLSRNGIRHVNIIDFLLADDLETLM